MRKIQTVQRLVLNNDGSLPEELFCRGNYRYAGGKLVLEEGGEASFNTYFNSFFAAERKRLTEIERVRFLLKLCGTGRVQIRRTDSRGNEKLLAEVPFALKEETELTIGSDYSLSRLGTVCWLRILADRGGVSLTGGCVVTESEARQVRFACCFCTYQREREIRRTVQTLLKGVSAEDSPLKERVDFYIADNGHTLRPEDFGDAEQVFLFENPNYGGSGGFTRCLMEAGLKNKGRYSHLILMDDDALILSSVLERTAQLAAFLKPEYQAYMIGGALLSQQQPWLQVENGAEFRRRGSALNGERIDLRIFENVRRILRRDRDVNYNAWFFACIPGSFVTDTNLPLPFFLHGDDIEYGLRFQKRILSLNGICAWHPDPTTNRKPAMNYYNHRNYSIIEAIHGADTSAEQYLVTEGIKILRYLTEYRYDDALCSIRGSEDFLKGIDWLRRQDPEALNREVMAWRQQERCHIEHAAEQIPAPSKAGKRNRLVKLLNLALPIKTERRVYGADAGWPEIDHGRTGEICIVDPVTGDGLRYRRDRQKQREVWKAFRQFSRHLLAEYGRIAEQWRERWPELANETFWREYLGLDQEKQGKVPDRDNRSGKETNL